MEDWDGLMGRRDCVEEELEFKREESVCMHVLMWGSRGKTQLSIEIVKPWNTK